MKAVLPFAMLLAILLLGPILLHRQAGRSGESADETLVIISPHNEATRYEFARAFREAHFAKTGRRVFVDWRTAGGTSEIARYVAAQYLGSFRNYWTQTLHRPWTPECAAFDDPKAMAAGTVAARKAFLASKAGCGVDLFFGGGSFDYMQMTSAGRLVDCGVIAAHPDFKHLAGKRFGTRKDVGSGCVWGPSGYVTTPIRWRALGSRRPRSGRTWPARVMQMNSRWRTRPKAAQWPRRLR